MHELPKELNKSLRSWRGSIYRGNSVRRQPSDLEKGVDDFGEKTLSEDKNETQTSLVPHPTYSSHALRQAWREGQPPHDLVAARAPPEDAEAQSTGQRRLGEAGSKSQEHASPPAESTKQKPTRLAHQKDVASGEHSLFSEPQMDDPDPAATRSDDDMKALSKQDFYELIGMREPTDQSQHPRDMVVPGGLYSRIDKTMRYVQWKFRIFDWVTYIFLCLQILLSAVFIVLGSLSKVDSHIAIAVLGAIAAAIAGTLALMKGQGLPNRLRQTRDSLKNVVFEADELYWDVGADRPVLYKDIKKIREDYLRVMTEARKNHPDTWNATSDKLASVVKPRTKATTTAATAV